MKDLDGVRAQIAVLQHVKQKELELKELKERARAAVEDALGDDENGTLDGELVIRWGHTKTRRLNQKALKDHHPELVEEFTELNEQRRFEVL